MRTEDDLHQLYLELLTAWQLHRAKQQYSQCLPALLKPSNERSMDERHLAVCCQRVPLTWPACWLFKRVLLIVGLCMRKCAYAP